MTSLTSNLLDRRVPHSLALYIGVSWGCVQFTQFIVNEFLLSPHWTRVALSTVLLFLPSVLMLAWFHGKPDRNRAMRAHTGPDAAVDFVKPMWSARIGAPESTT